MDTLFGQRFIINKKNIEKNKKWKFSLLNNQSQILQSNTTLTAKNYKNE